MIKPKGIGRDFILSFFAQFVFSLVFCMLIPAFPIYLSGFGAKEGEIGLLIGAFSVSSLVLRPFVGRALLHIPERKFMMLGSLFCVFSSFSYLIAPPFWPLFMLRLFHGIGMALFATASFTLLANITPENHRGRLISYYYLSYNMAFALGPYFGMLIINRFNLTLLFLLCTALSTGSLYLAWKLSKRESNPAEVGSLRTQSLLSREVLPPAIVSFMLNVIWGTLCAFFPLYALRHGVSNPGIFFLFLALTLMLGRLLGGSILDRFNRQKLIMVCLGLIILATSLLPFATGLKLFIPVAIMLGIGWAFLYPFLTIYVIEHAGQARGPAIGTFTALGDLGAGLGPMIMGSILEKTGYPVMFACVIVTASFNFLYFYLSIEKRQERVGKEILLNPSYN